MTLAVQRLKAVEASLDCCVRCRVFTWPGDATQGTKVRTYAVILLNTCIHGSSYRSQTCQTCETHTTTLSESNVYQKFSSLPIAIIVFLLYADFRHIGDVFEI